MKKRTVIILGVLLLLVTFAAATIFRNLAFRSGTHTVTAHVLGTTYCIDTLTLGSGNFFILHDTTAIAYITAGNTGQVVVLEATYRDTIRALGNIKVSATWTGIVQSTLTLIYDGTNWVELARSVNP